MKTLPRPSEKQVQHGVRQLLTAAGCEVWDTSQPARALITPGLPDLLAFHPRRGLFFVEVKRPGGKQSPAQRVFQACCDRAGITYLCGGVDVVAAYLSARKEG